MSLASLPTKYEAPTAVWLIWCALSFAKLLKCTSNDMQYIDYLCIAAFLLILGNFVLCVPSIYHKWEKNLSASFIFLNKARGWAKEKNSFWLEMGYTSDLHRLLFNRAVWRRWFHFDVKRLVYFLLPHKQMKSECPLSLAKAFYLSSSRLSLWFFF